MNQYSIKEAQDFLKISRSTLYRHIKTLGIEPEKKGNKSYINKNELRQIETEISLTESHNKQKISLNDTQKKTVDTVSQDTDTVRHLIEIENLKTKNTTHLEQIEKLEDQLERERQNSKQITLMLGQAQGEANAYKEQAQELLEIQTSPKEEIKTIETETIPQEEQTEPKKSLFARIFRR